MTASLFYSGHDQEKLNDIRERAEGIPQVSEDVLFLLSLVDRHERIHVSLEEVLDRKASDNSVRGAIEDRRDRFRAMLAIGNMNSSRQENVAFALNELEGILNGIEKSWTEAENTDYEIERKSNQIKKLEMDVLMMKRWHPDKTKREI